MTKPSERIRTITFAFSRDDDRYQSILDIANEVARLERQVSAVKAHAKSCGFVCICCPLETTPGTFLGPDGNWYCEEHFKEIIAKEQPNA